MTGRGKRVSLGMLLAVNVAVWSLVIAGGASAHRTAPPDRGARATHPVLSGAAAPDVAPAATAFGAACVRRARSQLQRRQQPRQRRHELRRRVRAPRPGALRRQRVRARAGELRLPGVPRERSQPRWADQRQRPLRRRLQAVHQRSALPVRPGHAHLVREHPLPERHIYGQQARDRRQACRRPAWHLDALQDQHHPSRRTRLPLLRRPAAARDRRSEHLHLDQRVLDQRPAVQRRTAVRDRQAPARGRRRVAHVRPHRPAADRPPQGRFGAAGHNRRLQQGRVPDELARSEWNRRQPHRRVGGHEPRAGDTPRSPPAADHHPVAELLGAACHRTDGAAVADRLRR